MNPLVAQEILPVAHSVIWNGCDEKNRIFSYVIYLIQLTTDKDIQIEKVVFLHK